MTVAVKSLLASGVEAGDELERVLLPSSQTQQRLLARPLQDGRGVEQDFCGRASQAEK